MRVYRSNRNSLRLAYVSRREILFIYLRTTAKKNFAVIFIVKIRKNKQSKLNFLFSLSFIID
jgi:hypothetical protein